MNVIVLDGRQNQALACVRSISRAGHRAIVGETGWSKTAWSKYCFTSFRYRDPATAASGFEMDLLENVRKYSADVVLAMTEPTTLAISQIRDQLRDAGALVVLPKSDVLQRAFNKES